MLLHNSMITPYVCQLRFIYNSNFQAGHLPKVTLQEDDEGKWFGVHTAPLIAPLINKLTPNSQQGLKGTLEQESIDWSHQPGCT